MIEMSVVISGKTYHVDSQAPKSLAIPLQFNGEQPNFFGAPRAQARPIQGDGFIGDTQHGGSCNVAEIHMVPHCNGTHTETVGHIVHARHSVVELLSQSLMPSVVISGPSGPSPPSGSEATTEMSVIDPPSAPISILKE